MNKLQRECTFTCAGMQKCATFVSKLYTMPLASLHTYAIKNKIKIVPYKTDSTQQCSTNPLMNSKQFLH